ncbi:MAG: hypothetical protein ACREDU_03780, partial [Methylocella sp.]
HGKGHSTQMMRHRDTLEFGNPRPQRANRYATSYPVGCLDGYNFLLICLSGLCGLCGEVSEG